MMLTKLRNSKRGFTLIELLVVIAIIGILSAVVLASLQTARQKARDAKRISDVGQIQLALELYYDANTNYPPTALAACDADADFGGTNCVASSTLVSSGYLPKIPQPGNQVTWTEYAYFGVTGTASPFTPCYAGATCTSYVMAARLERTDNTQVLSNDADSVVTLAADDFNGANPQCDVGNSGAEDCFDVRP